LEAAFGTAEAVPFQNNDGGVLGYPTLSPERRRKNGAPALIQLSAFHQLNACPFKTMAGSVKQRVETLQLKSLPISK
jgi:hypothetical protein